MPATLSHQVNTPQFHSTRQRLAVATLVSATFYCPHTLQSLKSNPGASLLLILASVISISSPMPNFKEYYETNKSKILAKQSAYRNSMTPEQRALNLKAKRDAWHSKYQHSRRIKTGAKPMTCHLAAVVQSKSHKRAKHLIYHYTRKLAFFIKKPTRFHPVIQCTKAQFITHVESLFSNGMSWNNYGRNGIWEFDHVKPLCQFNLSIESQVLEAAHFSNVRPLLRTQNLERSKTQKKFPVSPNF
jgi:hypothetical protein